VELRRQRDRLLPDRLEQPEGYLPAQYRRGLQDPPRGVREPIQARHQHALDRVWNDGVGAALPVLNRHARQLLQEEGVALAALQDHARQRLGNPVLPQHRANHAQAVRRAEASQGELRHV
jgi:hypothetical protein